jgi:hypothetical protein
MKPINITTTVNIETLEIHIPASSTGSNDGRGSGASSAQEDTGVDSSVPSSTTDSPESGEGSSAATENADLTLEEWLYQF